MDSFKGASVENGESSNNATLKVDSEPPIEIDPSDDSHQTTKWEIWAYYSCVACQNRWTSC